MRKAAGQCPTFARHLPDIWRARQSPMQRDRKKETKKNSRGRAPEFITSASESVVAASRAADAEDGLRMGSRSAGSVPKREGREGKEGRALNPRS